LRDPKRHPAADNGHKPGFEETVAQLEQIIARLESEALSLEASLEAFEQGIGLVRSAEAMLNGAERRVEILLAGPAGDEDPAREAFAPPGPVEDEA